MENVATDTAQTKKSLPLFGKKKTFGFDKLKLQVTTTTTKQPSISSNQSQTSAGESIEEFDDDEDGREASVKMSKIPSSNTETASANNDDTFKKESKKCDEPTSASETNANEIPPSKQKENENEKEKCKEEEIDEPNESMSSKQHVSSTVNASNVENSSGSSTGTSNKQRSRNRQRNRLRHQIDIDDTEEDTSPQKYSGWMPPENQTGDGITDLNSKYGY